MSRQPLYEVYLKTDEGMRGTVVEGITGIEILYRKNEPSKWTLSGSSLGECPIAETASLLIFRNGVCALSGYVEKIELAYDAATRIYDWEVSGLSDLGRLNDRLGWVIPTSATPKFDDNEYKDEGRLSDILLTLANVNGGPQAQQIRQISGLTFGTLPRLGDDTTIGVEYDKILDYIQEKLEDSGLVLRETWDGSSGAWAVVIAEPGDVSEKIVFSVESGSISSWKRTVAKPKGNWLLVKGCKNKDTDETLSVIVSDADSIEKWGRIELTVSRSDIKQIVEKDDDGNVTYTEPWSSVQSRLQEAAYEELEKASAQYGYELTILDIDRFAYKTDWDLNDIVAVRIGSEQFTAQIEEVKLSVSNGVETVTPSVGTIQKGELQTVFDTLGELKEQIKVLQKE